MTFFSKKVPPILLLSLRIRIAATSGESRGLFSRHALHESGVKFASKLCANSLALVPQFPGRVCGPRSRVHPHIANAISRRGDKKKSLQNLYPALSDDDLLREIDKMRFDFSVAEIRVKN